MQIFGGSNKSQTETVGTAAGKTRNPSLDQPLNLLSDTLLATNFHWPGDNEEKMGELAKVEQEMLFRNRSYPSLNPRSKNPLGVLRPVCRRVCGNKSSSPLRPSNPMVKDPEFKKQASVGGKHDKLQE